MVHAGRRESAVCVDAACGQGEVGRVPESGSEPAPERRLRRESGEPLWKQLLADLRRRLDVGEFADAFPGGLELRDAYGVIGHTVREAWRPLREEGVVVAARGK